MRLLTPISDQGITEEDEVLLQNEQIEPLKVEISKNARNSVPEGEVSARELEIIEQYFNMNRSRKKLQQDPNEGKRSRSQLAKMPEYIQKNSKISPYLEKQKRRTEYLLRLKESCQNAPKRKLGSDRNFVVSGRDGKEGDGRDSQNDKKLPDLNKNKMMSYEEKKERKDRNFRSRLKSKQGYETPDIVQRGRLTPAHNPVFASERKPPKSLRENNEYSQVQQLALERLIQNLQQNVQFNLFQSVYLCY